MAGTQQTAYVYSSYWKGAIAVSSQDVRSALAAAARIANKELGCDTSLLDLEKPGISLVIWREKKNNILNLNQLMLVMPKRCPLCGVTLRPKAIKCHDCGNYDLSQVQSSV